MKTLTDKVIIVIGATGGIGSVLAREFVNAGAKVILSSRTEETLRALQITLGIEQTFVVPGNASRAEDVKVLFAKAFEQYGRVDAVIITTGKWEQVSIDTPIDEAITTAEKHMQSFYLTTFTVSFIAQEFLRKLGGGLIVNISSHAAVRPHLHGNLTYGPAKAASYHLIQALRSELEGTHVRLVDLQPAIVKTPGNMNALNTEEKQKGAVQPEEIAQWIIKNFDNPNIPQSHLFDSSVIL